jgi:hypothetical protein
VYSILNFSQACKKIVYKELPDEILLKIFSTITDGAVLAKAGRVCKQWYRVAKDNSIWQTLFQRFKMSSTFPKRCSLFSQDNENASSQCSANNSKRCSIPWRAKFIAATEEMHDESSREIKRLMANSIPNVSLSLILPLGFKGYRSFRLLSRFYEQCLTPFVAHTEKFGVLRARGITSVEILFSDYFHFSRYTGGNIYLNIFDSPQAWLEYLLSVDFASYCDYHETLKRADEEEKALTSKIASVLNVKSITFIADHYSKSFAEEIVREKDLFAPLHASKTPLTKLFIGGRFCVSETWIEVPSTCSMTELLNFLVRHHTKVQPVLEAKAKKREESFRLLHELQRSVEKLLFTQITASYHVTESQMRRCYEHLLSCNESLQLAIQREKVKFCIVTRKHFEAKVEKEWPIWIPWDFKMSELEQILELS